jgi:archaellum biogenesis ATPase FlaH
MECRDKIKHYISNITAMSGGKVDINISDIDTTNIEIALQQILEQVATLIKQNAPEDLTIKANELLLNYQLKSELYLQEKVEYINYDIKKIDLYLPSLASNYHYDKNKQQFILEDRKERLHHESENIDHFIQGFVKKGFNGSGKKLAFIEGSPGSGKTMFSQKFAFENVLAYFDENNKEVDFLPIYVRLRDWKETPPYEKYTTILSDSEVFLKRLVSNTFKTKGLSPAQKNKESDALDKLEDNDIRGKKVVFILDGLDEMELQGSQDSQDFIQEVSDFLGYFNNPEDQNQNFLTIITGRPFQNKINKKLANKIDWYYLDGFKYYKNKKEQVLDKKNEWAKNYDKCNNLSIEGKNSFQNFITNLKNSEVYKKNKGIQSIFSEPFIIFNIAKLVLENKLKVEDLQANASYVRILIYEKVIFETIQKSREQDQKNDLFEGKIDLKYEFIQKLATGIFNVNGEQAKIGVIKERISRGKDSLNSVLQKITCPEEVKRIEQNQDLTNEEKEQQKKDVYNQNFKKIKDDNLLSFFYFKHDPNPDDFWDSNIEFAHKSFGEFLQAREIWQTLFNLKKLIKNFDEENLNHLSKTKIEDLKWEKVLEHSELSEKIYKILYNLLYPFRKPPT